MKKNQILVAALFAVSVATAAPYTSPMQGSYDMYGVTNAVISTNCVYKAKNVNMSFTVNTNFIEEAGIHQFGYTLRNRVNNGTPLVTRLSAADFVLPFAQDEKVTVATNGWYWLVKSGTTGKGAFVWCDFDGELDTEFVREAKGLRVRIGQHGINRKWGRDGWAMTPVVSLMKFDDEAAALNALRGYVRKFLPRDPKTFGIMRPYIEVIGDTVTATNPALRAFTKYDIRVACEYRLQDLDRQDDRSLNDRVNEFCRWLDIHRVDIARIRATVSTNDLDRANPERNYNYWRREFIARVKKARPFAAVEFAPVKRMGSFPTIISNRDLSLAKMQPVVTVDAKEILEGLKPETEKYLGIWRQVARLILDGEEYRLGDKAIELFDESVGRGVVLGSMEGVEPRGLKPDAKYVYEKLDEKGEVTLIRELVAERSVPAYSSSTYAEGMYAQWDAKENAGRGVHDDKTKTWRNLVNPRKSLVYAAANPECTPLIRKAEIGFGRGDDRRDLFYNDDFGAWWRDIGDQWTFEAFVTPSQWFKSDCSGILGNHYSGCNGLVFGQFESDRSGKHRVGFSFSRWNQPGAGVSLLASGIQDRVPVHFAFECTGTNVVLYTNAVLVGRAALPKDVKGFFSAGPFRIGRCYDDRNRHFDGSIHAVRIYSKALTEEELADNLKVDRARFAGASFCVSNAVVSVEGSEDMIFRAMPVGAPAAPSTTVVRVTADYFRSPFSAKGRPDIRAAVGYSVTNLAEGIVWRCDKAELAGYDRETAEFELVFQPTAYLVKALPAKNGSIEPAEGWAPADGEYTVIARPDEGSSFYRWIKGIGETYLMKQEAVIRAKGPMTVAVEFESEEISDDDFGQ